MNKDELEKLVTSLSKMAAEIVRESEQHLPMLHVITSDNSIEFIGIAGFGDEASKRALRALCELKAEQGAQALVFITEAWMAGSQAAAYAKLVERRPIAAHDDRVETLMIVGASSDGSQIGRFYKIVRDSRGRHVEASSRLEFVHSRFIDRLPWKRG